MSFTASVALLSGVYLLVGRLERVPAIRFRRLSTPRPYLATDLAWYAVAVGATAVSVFVVRPVLEVVSITSLRHAVAAVPYGLKLLAGVVVFDFVSFLVHRALHRFDLLWSLHKVHHSTLELDGLATTRTHMVENMLRFLPGQALLFLIGMPVSVVAASVAIAAVYGVSNHSNIALDLQWLETLLVTPRLHRRHHVPATTMNNYGGIFTVWDRVFGTLVRLETADEERFGLPGEMETYPQRFASALRQPLLDALSRQPQVTDTLR